MTPFIHFHFCSETHAEWDLQNGQSFTGKSGEMGRRKSTKQNKKPKAETNHRKIENSINIILIPLHYQLHLQEDNKCHIPVWGFFCTSPSLLSQASYFLLDSSFQIGEKGEGWHTSKGIQKRRWSNTTFQLIHETQASPVTDSDCLGKYRASSSLAGPALDSEEGSIDFARSFSILFSARQKLPEIHDGIDQQLRERAGKLAILYLHVLKIA